MMNMDLPEYTGEAMSAMVSLAPIENVSVDLWGWVPMWGEQESTHKAMEWYRDDITTPVLLAFSISHQPQEQVVPLLNPFPLPQIGEYAILDKGDGENVVCYHILDLPIETRQLWLALGEALRKLAAPLLWPAFTARHMLASDENEYQRQQLSLDTQRQLAIGKTRDELLIEDARLGAAHIHIEQLRKVLAGPDQAQQWEEVRRMAKRLAQDYHEHALAKLNAIEEPETESTQDESTPLQDALQTMVQPYLMDTQAPIPIAPKKKKPGSRPMQEPTPIVARKQTIVTELNHRVNVGLVPMLRDKNSYTQYVEQKTARGTKDFGKEYGNMTIDIKPANGEGWDSVLTALTTLGDEVVDAYNALFAIGLDQNGVEHIREPFLISPDDILEMCGKEKSNRAYTTAQRAETIKHMKTLSMVNISATLPAQNKFHTRRRGRPKGGEIVTPEGTFIKAKGPLIYLLDFTIGEYSTITGEALWERQSVSIGEWATMIPDLNKNTAKMLRQVLKYSAKNQRYQKRIGLYLTMMFRINASRNPECRFTHGIGMRAVLDGSGIAPTYHDPQRFKNAIERALEDLKKDGVIKGYYQMVDAHADHKAIEKEVREQARGWFDLWLQNKYNFIAPDIIQEQYKSVQERAESKRDNPPRGGK